MKILFYFILLLLHPVISKSSPLIWESQLGTILNTLTNDDDAHELVQLSFNFPFPTNTNSEVVYSNIYVGNNGCIKLGSLGNDIEIGYDYSISQNRFFAGGAPVICINTDFDNSSTGTVHFIDLGNKAVFTWNEVGTNAQPTHLSTFQIQIFASGDIYISFNGILNDLGEGLISSLSEGIVVGITTGSLPADVDPGTTDLSITSTSRSSTIFERWCYSMIDSCGFNSHNTGLSGDINTNFDLDFYTVTFTRTSMGYKVNDVIFLNGF